MAEFEVLSFISVFIVTIYVKFYKDRKKKKKKILALQGTRSTYGLLRQLCNCNCDANSGWVFYELIRDFVHFQDICMFGENRIRTTIKALDKVYNTDTELNDLRKTLFEKIFVFKNQRQL